MTSRPYERAMDGIGRGRDVVLVIGVFDLFHRGHVELLKNASAFGSKLVVVINGDEFTAAYKRRPIFNEDDRLNIVRSLKTVDVAVVSNSPDAKPIIEEHGVTVIVHGDDWDHESYLKQICVDEAYLRDKRIRMQYLPYYEGISTSDTIAAVADRR